MSKKIILWIDSNFLHFCIAYYLQKKFDCKLYAIIDITNRSKNFFLTQKLVKFEKTWFYFDHVNPKNKSSDLKYLQHIEKKFDLNLWQLAVNERIFYKFNNFYKFDDKEIESILTQECKLFESIIHEVKPDSLLIKETIQHKDHLFYEMCKKSNVDVLMVYLTKTVNKCVISPEAHKFDRECNFESIPSLNRSFDDLQNYLKNSNLLGKFKNLQKSFLNSKILRLKAAMDFLIFYNNSNLETHYTYFGRKKLKVLLHEIKSSYAKKSRRKFIDRFFLKEIPKNEKFVYFPLQVDQERNLLIAAPFLTEQLEVIRYIVKSLPIGYKLYVKEHIAQELRNWRDVSEYEEILKIPNVRLFHPTLGSEEFYQKSSLLITVGGSTGLEATFYGTASLIFADLDYSVLPSIHKLDSLSELRNAISSHIDEKVDPVYLDKYLQFIEENSFDFDWLGFLVKQYDFFFFGGQFVDVEITESKMKQFLDDNEDMLLKITDEHLKKMNSTRKF